MKLGTKSNTYYCDYHKSSKGYTDSDGVWHCWACYKEDRYLSPIGEVIQKLRVGQKEVRAVVTNDGRVMVELWEHRGNNHTLTSDNQHTYLSTATRAYNGIVNKLQNKKDLEE